MSGNCYLPASKLFKGNPRGIDIIQKVTFHFYWILSHHEVQISLKLGFTQLLAVAETSPLLREGNTGTVKLLKVYRFGWDFHLLFQHFQRVIINCRWWGSRLGLWPFLPGVLSHSTMQVGQDGEERKVTEFLMGKRVKNNSYIYIITDMYVCGGS